MKRLKVQREEEVEGQVKPLPSVDIEESSSSTTCVESTK